MRGALKGLGGRAVGLVLAVLVSSSQAAPVLVDFEAFANDTVLSSQVPGLVFGHATVLTAGIGLDEFEFPPHSGLNAAFDDSGPMRIDFGTPVSELSGHFTYNLPLLLQAYDANDVLLVSVASLFAANTALTGEPGSAPNELLTLAADKIAYVVVTGSEFGGSFTVDDLAVTFAVPEPAASVLLLVAAAGAACFSVRRRRSRR